MTNMTWVRAVVVAGEFVDGGRWSVVQWESENPPKYHMIVLYVNKTRDHWGGLPPSLIDSLFYANILATTLVTFATEIKIIIVAQWLVQII